MRRMVRAAGYASRHFEESTKKDGKECIHYLSALIEMLEIKGDADSCKQAIGYAEELEVCYDPIRKKYWKMRADQFRDKVHV